MPVSNKTTNTANLSQKKQHARNMGKNTQDNLPTDDETTHLEMVTKRFKSSRGYARRGFWDTWAENYKLYNSQRVKIGYDGNSDVFVPETYTLVQGMKAHLVNGNLNVEFKPTHPDQTGDVEVLQDLFDYAWEKDYMDQKIDSTVESYLIAGNAYIFTFVGEDGLPCSRYVDAKDAFFDPTATDYWSLLYCGYRYLTTVEELKKSQVTNGQYDSSKAYDANDPSTQPKIGRYKHLDDIEGGWDDTNNLDKTAKQEREDMLSGSIMDKDDMKDQVEVIVYIDHERMITLANRKWVIEDIETPFKRKKKTMQSADDQGNPVSFDMPAIDPFLPVAPFRDIVDGNMFYARGEVEIIAESQERLNDVQSQKSDNLSFILNRMWTLDPAYAQKIDEIQSIPGAVFTIPPGALEQVPTQPIGADADNEIARIKQEMGAATASNELMHGTLQTSGRQSAYQINQGLVMQGSRFAVKIRNLEREGFKILVQNMWKIMQIYIDKEIPIRVGGEDAKTWGAYNPGLYLGDWDVKIMLGSSAEAVKEAEKQQTMQFFLLASKLPFIDQQKLFAMTATTLFEKSKRDVAGLISPPPPTPPPAIQPKLIETIKFEQLYPDEQAELLAESGVTPSPMREQATGQPNPIAKATVNPMDPQTGAPMAPQDYHQSNMEPAKAKMGAPGQQVANIPGTPQ